MGKKVVAIFLILLLFLAAGLLTYRLKTRRPHHAARLASTSPVAAPESSSSGTSAAGSSGSTPGDAGSKKGFPPAEPGYSPRPGETLTYEANVTKLESTIAHLKVVVAEHRNLTGKNSWHLQAFVHTDNPYRMVFELDDQFDSYSDVGSLTSLQYEMHLSERGQKVDSVQRMLPSTTDAAPPNVTAARVLPGTRDPLGLLQYLRGVDWNKTHEVRCPVYDGHKLYDVRAVLVAKAVEVSVPADDYTAAKIEIHVLENGVPMKEAHFLLYLANDAARTPVLMEAVLPVATVRVMLTDSN
jgi:Protein of unknown function (DUF3108)